MKDFRFLCGIMGSFQLSPTPVNEPFLIIRLLNRMSQWHVGRNSIPKHVIAAQRMRKKKKSTFFYPTKKLLLVLNEILEKWRYFYTEHAIRSCLHIYQLKFNYSLLFSPFLAKMPSQYIFKWNKNNASFIYIHKYVFW